MANIPPAASASISGSPSRSNLTNVSSSPSPGEGAITDEILVKAHREFVQRIQAEKNAYTVLLLAWHDAATYDAKLGKLREKALGLSGSEKDMQAGGPNGSIRHSTELKKNKDLQDAATFCDRVKNDLKLGKISYADLYQLAGVAAIEAAGGPKIEFITGREDSTSYHGDERFPVATEEADAEYVREKFYRMGFEDNEIVALIGGHALVRAFQEASKSQIPPPSTIAQQPLIPPANSLSTVPQFTFDELWKKKETHLRSTIEKSLLVDAVFFKLAKQYAENNNRFMDTYKQSHKRMSELGFKYFPQHVKEKQFSELKQHILIATTVTILVAFLGFVYEVMIR